MKDTDALTEQIVAAYEAEVRVLLAGIGPGKAQADRLLSCCEAIGKGATARLFEAASEQAARCEARPLCPECGRAMARHDRWRRPVISLSGEYRGWFQRFRCEQCRTGACPSEQGWLRYGCTPQVIEVALSSGARMPFEAA